MGQSNILICSLVVFQLTCEFNGALAQNRTLIDVDTDIPATDAWDIWDCGYADLSADYYCDAVGSEGGISIPPDDLAGEKGFWSTCAYRCVVKYIVQPGDASFKARIYQRNLNTEVSYDGIRWDYLDGTGWIEFPQVLEGTDKKEINLKFDRLGDDWFTVLDKIVVNGEFDPPSDPTTTTEQTTTTDRAEPTTSSPECPTTTSPEPCNCCDRCPQGQPQQIHNHYYYSLSNNADTKDS